MNNLSMNAYHKPDVNALQELKDIANKLRINCVKATSCSESGHPTSCSSIAEIMSVLFFHTMRYKVSVPRDPSSDRFILSKGHAAPILYAAWAEAGLFPESDLLNLRKIDSDLEGHPTPRLNFVDVATGSLGQGLSVGCGMAYIGKYVDNASYKVYCVIGDGESAEGSIWEALSFAGSKKLNNIVAIFDINRLGQSEPTAFQHDMNLYKSRLESFGFNAYIVDGHDVETLCKVFHEAAQSTDKPTAILAKTTKGKGFPGVADEENWHGRPLGPKAEAALTALQFQIRNFSPTHLEPQKPVQDDAPPVDISNVALASIPQYRLDKFSTFPPTTTNADPAFLTRRVPWWWTQACSESTQEKKRASRKFHRNNSHPGMKVEWKKARAHARYILKNARRVGEKAPTRRAFGTAIAKLAQNHPRVFALDGDPKDSTDDYPNTMLDVDPNRVILCPLAEQNLVGLGIGAACRDRTVVFCSTYAERFNKAFDQLRMGAISQTNLNCVASDCGISVGVDGPTGTGLDDLALFRSLPDSTVFYPSDVVATERAVEIAANTKGICYIRLSSADTGYIYDNEHAFQIGKSHVIRKSESDQVLLIAAGVTIGEAIRAADSLTAEGISVRILDPFTIKPLDQEGIIRNANECLGRILVVEDHYPEGGIGEAVMSAVTMEPDIIVRHLAVLKEALPPKTPEEPLTKPQEASAKPYRMLDQFGISGRLISEAIRELITA